MAGSVNKCIIVGNLGKDPEIRTTQSGDRIANLSVATSETWRDKQSGERKERTEWHRVVIFGDALAGVAEKYLRKGSKVYLEGQLQTRKWQDQSGADRYSTEIVLQPFRGTLTMLDSPSDTNRDDTRPRPERDDPRTGGGAPRGYGDDYGDDIPFAPCM